MHKAVTLAVRARDSYMETLPPNMPMPKIALSLGPYGATLSPAAEFTGIYPPPYGPSRPVTFFAGGQADNTQKERDAEDLLVQFHLERLRIMSSSKETWDAIDIIAFETIPLLREARSIRRAMTLLAETNPSTRLPPWWISFTFPNGVLPEQRADGVHCSAGDALKSCFEQYSPASIAVPSAFGINCTQVKYLSKCLSLASEALQHLGDNLPISDQNMLFSHHQRQRTGPGLVLYCNGGRVYNPNTMTWLPVASTSSSLKDLPESEVWAVGMAEAVYEGVSTKANWGGLLIGGCCKTEPEHILALRNLI
jgi:homocysteine S-methyltransferase